MKRYLADIEKKINEQDIVCKENFLDITKECISVFSANKWSSYNIAFVICCSTFKKWHYVSHLCHGTFSTACWPDNRGTRTHRRTDGRSRQLDDSPILFPLSPHAAVRLCARSACQSGPGRCLGLSGRRKKSHSYRALKLPQLYVTLL